MFYQLSRRPLLAFYSLVFLLFAGCASQSDKPELIERFTTDIKADGSKQFHYSLSRVGGDTKGKSKNRKGRGQGGAKGGGRGGSSSRKEEMRGKALKLANERMETNLLETGYCREGYLEQSSSMARGRSQYWGECREAASDEDRQKFPNSLSSPTRENGSSMPINLPDPI